MASMQMLDCALASHLASLGVHSKASNHPYIWSQDMLLRKNIVLTLNIKYPDDCKSYRSLQNELG
jgi:hypothetical protein